jgi:hypothetical protein
MRHLFSLLLCTLLAACAINPPLPAVDPHMAWIDLYTQTGKLVMAERLDGKRLDDGRYFQVTPGSHELMIRFDYEVTYGLNWADPQYRTCYLKVRYADFKAGQRYRLEGWVLGVDPEARLHDAQRNIVATNIATNARENCLF